MRREDAGSPVALVETLEVAGLGRVSLRSLRLSEIMPLIGGEDGRRQELRWVARSVLAEDGEPLWTEEQWDVWAGRNMTEWTKLAQAVARMCGLDVVASEGN